MPAEQRSQEFAQAALRIVGREGLGAVSFRTVAAEAGWSLGAVQKAFRSKDELVAAALREARAAVEGGDLGDPGRPTLRGWLVGLILATLPLDDERRQATLVGVSFADKAPFDPSIARVIAEGDDELRRRLALLFRRAQAEGELDRDLDVDRLARTLLALAAGLAGQLLYDPQPEPAVRRLVESAVAALTAPPFTP